MSLEDCQVEVGTTLMSRATLWPQTRLGPCQGAVKPPTVSEATVIPGMLLSFLQDGQARAREAHAISTYRDQTSPSSNEINPSSISTDSSGV